MISTYNMVIPLLLIIEDVYHHKTTNSQFFLDEMMNFLNRLWTSGKKFNL